MLAGQGGQDDWVSSCQLAETVERRAVRRPVAGDGDIAGLSGQCRPVIVARALSQLGGAGSCDDVLVQTDRWNLQPGQH